MTLDLNMYVLSKPFIQNWFVHQHGLSLSECVSLISATTHVPVLCCAFYIGEVAGWSEESLNKIYMLIKSYNYDEIIGIPDSFPGRKI